MWVRAQKHGVGGIAARRCGHWAKGGASSEPSVATSRHGTEETVSSASLLTSRGCSQRSKGRRRALARPRRGLVVFSLNFKRCIVKVKPARGLVCQSNRKWSGGCGKCCGVEDIQHCKDKGTFPFPKPRFSHLSREPWSAFMTGHQDPGALSTHGYGGGVVPRPSEQTAREHVSVCVHTSVDL